MSTMSTMSTFFTHKKTIPHRPTCYIVRDDFIVNLKRGKSLKPTPIKTQMSLPPEVTTSSVMVSKKLQLLGKIKIRGRNSFYDIDRQIQQNKLTLYRKLNVALRKSRIQCKFNLENPFAAQPSHTPNHSQDQQKLTKLIFNIQPYWVKRSLLKSKIKIK